MSDARRGEIEAELLDWMAQPRCGPWPQEDEKQEERFERLALALFELQFDLCTAYGRFCRARGTTPSSVRDWRDIPAVPTGAFKEIALRCFAPECTRKIFRTSGTTAGRRGKLHLDTLALYEASLRRTAQTLLFSEFDTPNGEARVQSRAAGPESGARAAPVIRALAASPEESGDSSLSHMLGLFVRELGARASGFDVEGSELRVDSLVRALERCHERQQPIALCGTAFAFVHLLDALAARGLRFRCPPGSLIMETGGFKGRARTLPREQLYCALARQLTIPCERIVNQYGMTELGSQFYDSVIVDPGRPRRKLGPPWVRLRLINPTSGHEVAAGAVGTIVVHDLANTGSVAAVETADLGRHVLDGAGRPIGFEVLGREQGAEARGCSIAADAMLADGA